MAGREDRVPTRADMEKLLKKIPKQKSFKDFKAKAKETIDALELPVEVKEMVLSDVGSYGVYEGEEVKPVSREV